MKALKAMAREHGVDYVFAEPSGIVVPFELRNTIASAGRDARVKAGSVVMLLNAADPALPFHDHVAHVTRQQVAQADVIAVTKQDDASEGGVECLEQAARGLAPDTPLHVVSTKSRVGLAELVEAVLGPAA